MIKKKPIIEPNLAIADQWWGDLPDIWTPVGWKDHLFRFNVMFNGTIMAQPCLNRRTVQWAGQGVQLMFQPSLDGGFFRPGMPRYLEHDDGSIHQGWNRCAAPVLWTEWVYDGLVLREEVFSHIPGARDVTTGIDPLYAWIRLSIHDSCPGLPLDEKYGFAIKINAPYITHTMEIRNNTVYHPENSSYPRELTAGSEGYQAESGWYLLENDGKVRLAVAPLQQCSVQFQPKQPTEKDSLLYVQMSAKKGAHVDILLPMLPTPKTELDSELALGYDRALREASRYWSIIPKTAATFEVPEERINETIKHSLKFAEVIAEKDPATGITTTLTGSWEYADLWTTPMAMTCVFTLDSMGYHQTVEKYLQMFKREQGTVPPPGNFFKLHPGYLSTPQSLTSVNWLTDHGAVLYAISEHALLSNDLKIVNEWLPVIVKACDFIKDARAITGHGGAPGIMPPAVANDMGTKTQAIWSDGWMYKGLTTAIKLLKKTGHPRAAEFEAEARAYKEAFLRAMRSRTQSMPQWVDAKGKVHHFVPTSVFGDEKWESRHAFYLDTGPLFMVFSGLMDATDPLMRSSLAWFREGPPTKLYRRDGNCFQVPSLLHEMSSCEPNCSWNVFHSHQLGDRMSYLEGMYSLFAGMVSRKTYTACETRGGVTGCTPSLITVFLARLAIVDDQIADNELHLLRMMPIAWLRTDQESRFLNMPTEFGPVSVRARLAAGGKELQVSFSSDFRSTPKRIILHIPPAKGLQSITLNGRVLQWDGKQDSLVIPYGRQR